MTQLEIELQSIGRANDLRAIKEILRDHAVSDFDRHKEIMDILKPISDAFKAANGFKKVIIAIGLVIAFAISAFLGLLQIRKML